jgi:hypothetical protein
MAPATAKPSIADTFTRLLRLNLGGGPPQVSRMRLMDASEKQLARAARSGTAREQQVAGPLLANPKEYRTWEAEQARSLLSTAFSLVHRSALFEYFRAQAPRETGRRLLIQHFHGNKSYSRAMVAEHSNYQRSFSSLLCVEHIGATMLVHQAFGDPFHRYENLYAEYFRSYCNSFLSPAGAGDDGSDSMRMLLPYLKRDVLDERARLLAMHSTADASHSATR